MATAADLPCMLRRRARRASNSRTPEIEITAAAISGVSRLRRALEANLRTYPCGDGGLICEDGRSRARPKLWRVSPDGSIQPDAPYNFRLREFVTAPVPVGAEIPSAGG
jgi:hypothetical protein